MFFFMAYLIFYKKLISFMFSSTSSFEKNNLKNCSESTIIEETRGPEIYSTTEQIIFFFKNIFVFCYINSFIITILSRICSVIIGVIFNSLEFPFLNNYFVIVTTIYLIILSFIFIRYTFKIKMIVLLKFKL